MNLKVSLTLHRPYHSTQHQRAMKGTFLGAKVQKQARVDFVHLKQVILVKKTKSSNISIDGKHIPAGDE